MLPSVCSVIDHRWRQNAVRTKKWHTRGYPTVSTLTNTKKSIWLNLLSIHMKQSHLVATRSKRPLIGSRKSRHCQTWLARRSPWNENLQRKQNWTAKSTNLVENARKIKTVFVIRAALWAEQLRRCLGCCGSWKSKLRKFAVAINTGSHSIPL